MGRAWVCARVTDLVGGENGVGAAIVAGRLATGDAVADCLLAGISSMTCEVGRSLAYNGYWVAFILVLPISADAASLDHVRRWFRQMVRLDVVNRSGLLLQQ